LGNDFLDEDQSPLARAAAGGRLRADVSSSEVLVLPDNCRDPELTRILQDAQEKYFARKHRRKPRSSSGS
jgi:hypothetical protein